MLLPFPLLFMPRHPSPPGAAVDSVLFSTFSPRILEHFTETVSSSPSASVKEATTWSPQMSPGSESPASRAASIFFRLLGFPKLD